MTPAKYRKQLPQLGPGLFLSDGGLETTLIFLEGLELPDFAAFDLLNTPQGELLLTEYFRRYAEIARRFGTGLILESATWRASADWGVRFAYSPEKLAETNRQSIRMLEVIRSEFETGRTPIVISGQLGPRGDGYVPAQAMTAKEAQAYHLAQIETFAGTAADMVSAMTMNYVEEAIGVALAAQSAGMPVAVSFTVETDGNLPTGQALSAAIEQVDEATSTYPSYYMINCAHPTHFSHALAQDGPWRNRIQGVRANASSKSHAELNESTELDIGDPVELGGQYARLRKPLPHLNVLGGCCGTDYRHVEQIAFACSPLFGAAG